MDVDIPKLAPQKSIVLIEVEVLAFSQKPIVPPNA